MKQKKLLALVMGVFSIVFVCQFFCGHDHYKDLSQDIYTSLFPEEILELENENRVENDLPPLVENEILQQAAEAKAKDMAEKGYFAHTSPEGYSMYYWLQKFMYKFLYAGEILAVGFRTDEGLVNAWMNSPTHEANIMNDKFVHTGIAIHKGEYKGVETEYVVQFFGTLMPTLDYYYQVFRR